MITTVTTTTVTTVTTVAMAGSLGAVLVLTLLVCLIHKEIVVPNSERWAQGLNRALTVAIVPLAAVFVLLLVSKVMEVLG